MQLGHECRIGRFEGQTAGQSLIENNAKRIDVTGRRGGAACGLLRGEVLGAAPNHLGPFIVLNGGQRTGDAEIGDLGPVVWCNKDVLGLKVTVDQPGAMRIANAAADLDQQFKSLLDRQTAAPPDKGL